MPNDTGISWSYLSDLYLEAAGLVWYDESAGSITEPYDISPFSPMSIVPEMAPDMPMDILRLFLFCSGSSKRLSSARYLFSFPVLSTSSVAFSVVVEDCILTGASDTVSEIVPEATSALISVVTSGVEQIDSDSCPDVLSCTDSVILEVPRCGGSSSCGREQLSADWVQLSGRITCECGISSAMRVVCGVFSFGREMKIIRSTAAAAATRRPAQRNAAALLALLREDEYFC